MVISLRIFLSYWFFFPLSFDLVSLSALCSCLHLCLSLCLGLGFSPCLYSCLQFLFLHQFLCFLSLSVSVPASGRLFTCLKSIARSTLLLTLFPNFLINSLFPCFLVSFLFLSLSWVSAPASILVPFPLCLCPYVYPRLSPFILSVVKKIEITITSDWTECYPEVRRFLLVLPWTVKIAWENITEH